MNDEKKERYVTRYRALRWSARRLIDKMQKIEDSPEYRSVWTINQIYNGPYRGESWESEVDSLKSLLDSLDKEVLKEKNDQS